MNPGICYIYEYKNNQKLRNAGFIKLIQHYQSCVLQINIRGIPVQTGGTVKLYAFYRQSPKIISSLVDEIICGDKCISARFTISDTTFPDRRPLEQIDGFFLKTDTDQYYTALSDGMEFDTREIKLWKKPETNTAAAPDETALSNTPLPEPDAEKSPALPESETESSREGPVTLDVQSPPEDEITVGPPPETELQEILQDLSAEDIQVPTSDNIEAETQAESNSSSETDVTADAFNDPQNVMHSDAFNSPEDDMPPEDFSFPGDNTPPEDFSFTEDDMPPEVFTLSKDDIQPEVFTLSKDDIESEAFGLSEDDIQSEALSLSKDNIQSEALSLSKDNIQSEAFSLSEEDIQSEAVSSPEIDIQPEAFTPTEIEIQPELRGSSETDIQSRELPPTEQKAEEPASTARKIQRSDLSILPRRCWNLANNSFLLHGYHNYNHLLLVEEEGRFWLGVPAVYSPREARAAELFGFPQFTKTYADKLDLEEDEKATTPDFGHFCRYIK